MSGAADGRRDRGTEGRTEGHGSLLTADPEVHVVLFLLNTNENRKHRINVRKEIEASPSCPQRWRRLVLTAAASWHISVIVAENEASVSQVLRLSSTKLRPKTANGAGMMEIQSGSVLECITYILCSVQSINNNHVFL